jgi:hypothetical protein
MSRAGSARYLTRRPEAPGPELLCQAHTPSAPTEAGSHLLGHLDSNRGVALVHGSRLVYRLPRPAPDGRTVLRLSPLEFLERLSHLIPPLRLHKHRYHGVLAPNAGLRASVVAIGRPEVERTEVEDRVDLECLQEGHGVPTKSAAHPHIPLADPSIPAPIGLPR